MSETKKRPSKKRPASTYRGARRNAEFGRKPVGNTKPAERRAALARAKGAS